MRWETRAQGVKKDRAGLAQPVAVCEMSVQHLRGAGTVCKMTMQHLHGLFTVCKMSVQHLHSPFTVCEMTMQHLHSPFTVCGETMQHLHSPFTVCETIMQHLHSLFTVCGGTMQHLHGLFTVCAPVPRRLIIHPCGMSGGRMQFAPTRVPGKTWLASLTPLNFATVTSKGESHTPYYSHQKQERVMKKLLTLLLFPLLLQGCTKDEESKTTYGLVLDGYVTFSVSDAQGNDLLDPASTSPKAVDLSKVKVIYIENGKEKVCYNPLSDAPQAFHLVKPQADLNHYALIVYTDNGKIETKEHVSSPITITATTILEWEDGHRDVIDMEYLSPGNGNASRFQQKAWVNGRLIWDPANKIGGTQPMYEIKR